MDDAEAGNNETFNCLIELLKTSYVEFLSSIGWAGVEFDGPYNTWLLGSLFELMPEIDFAGPGSQVARLNAGCFYSPDGSSRIYFVEKVDLFFPGGSIGNVERVEIAADAKVSYEEYAHWHLAPWRDEYAACLDHRLSGDLLPVVLAIEDIPTLSETGLVLLILSLVAAGVVRPRFA